MAPVGLHCRSNLASLDLNIINYSTAQPRGRARRPVARHFRARRLALIRSSDAIWHAGPSVAARDGLYNNNRARDSRDCSDPATRNKTVLHVLAPPNLNTSALERVRSTPMRHWWPENNRARSDQTAAGPTSVWCDTCTVRNAPHSIKRMTRYSIDSGASDRTASGVARARATLARSALACLSALKLSALSVRLCEFRSAVRPARAAGRRTADGGRRWAARVRRPLAEKRATASRQTPVFVVVVVVAIAAAVARLSS